MAMSVCPGCGKKGKFQGYSMEAMTYCPDCVRAGNTHQARRKAKRKGGGNDPNFGLYLLWMFIVFLIQNVSALSHLDMGPASKSWQHLKGPLWLLYVL